MKDAQISHFPVNMLESRDQRRSSQRCEEVQNNLNLVLDTRLILVQLIHYTPRAGNDQRATGTTTGTSTAPALFRWRAGRFMSLLYTPQIQIKANIILV